MTKFEEFKRDFEKARADIGVKASDEDNGRSWTWNEAREAAVSVWCRLASALLVTELDRTKAALITDALDDVGCAALSITEAEVRTVADQYQMERWTAGELEDQIEMVSIFCTGISVEWSDEHELVGFLSNAADNIDQHKGWKAAPKPTNRWPPLPRSVARP